MLNAAPSYQACHVGGNIMMWETGVKTLDNLPRACTRPTRILLPYWSH